jgi:hypothetical protein
MTSPTANLAAAASPRRTRPWLGLLSFAVPGLGQMVSGRAERGALILGLVLLVGNLNAIFLSVYAPTMSLALPFFARGLPRLLHDIFSFYGIVFWIWQAIDAARLTSREGARG